MVLVIRPAAASSAWRSCSAGALPSYTRCSSAWRLRDDIIPVVGIGGSGFTGVTGGVICVHHTHAESYAQ